MSGVNRRGRVVLVGAIVALLVLVAGQGYAAHGWLGIPVYLVTGVVLGVVVMAVISAVERWVDRGNP